jgi:hypothetical protein
MRRFFARILRRRGITNMSKTAKKVPERSEARSTSSYGAIRESIKQMTDQGVEFEVSADGSLRVRRSSYGTYLKLDRKTK